MIQSAQLFGHYRHAADGPGFEHAVAARRDEPAVQRSGQHPDTSAHALFKKSILFFFPFGFIIVPLHKIFVIFY